MTSSQRTTLPKSATLQPALGHGVDHGLSTTPNLSLRTISGAVHICRRTDPGATDPTQSVCETTPSERCGVVVIALTAALGRWVGIREPGRTER